MKIGFLRFNMPVEIDVMKGSTSLLGTEIRMGLLHDWIKLGHEVTIYSKVRGFEQKNDRSPTKKSLFDFDETPKEEEISWMDKLKIKSEETNIDTDVLWIENAQPVTIFGDYIQRSLDVISKFEGTIVYHHHGDPAFAFPFGDALTEPTSTNDLNLRVMFKKNDIWTNKKWKVLSPVTNQELFKTISKGRSKISYKELEDKKLVQFGYIHPGHSDIEPYYPLKQSPEYDSLWIGGQNSSNKKNGSKKDSRLELIKKYYGSGKYKTGIMGAWEEKVSNSEMLGVQGKHGDAYKYWNNSLTCVNCASETNSKIGLQVTRPTMALRGGSIIMTDNNIHGVDRYIDPEYIVKSADEVKVVIDNLKSISVEEREKIRQKQLKKFPKWEEMNWKEIFE